MQPNCPYLVLLILQTIGAFIRDSTYGLAHWIFAFKYFQSAISMPELFGGKPVSDGMKRNLANLNTCMFWASIAVPFLFYVILLVFKLIYDQKDAYESLDLIYVYVALSCVAGAMLLAEAFILLYAVVKIRSILKENGLGDRANITMFIVNAGLFLFQVVAYCLWYF